MQGDESANLNCSKTVDCSRTLSEPYYYVDHLKLADGRRASVFSDSTLFTLLLSDDAQDRRRDLVFSCKSQAESFPLLPTKWLKTCYSNYYAWPTPQNDLIDLGQEAFVHLTHWF